MRRPSVKLKCVADHYADKSCERIVEFDGGLIAFRRLPNGKLLVNLYQLDSDVIVGVDPRFLVPAPVDT